MRPSNPANERYQYAGRNPGSGARSADRGRPDTRLRRALPGQQGRPGIQLTLFSGSEQAPRIRLSFRAAARQAEVGLAREAHDPCGEFRPGDVLVASGYLVLQAEEPLVGGSGELTVGGRLNPAPDDGLVLDFQVAHRLRVDGVPDDEGPEHRRPVHRPASEEVLDISGGLIDLLPADGRVPLLQLDNEDALDAREGGLAAVERIGADNRTVRVDQGHDVRPLPRIGERLRGDPSAEDLLGRVPERDVRCVFAAVELRAEKPSRLGDQRMKRVQFVRAGVPAKFLDGRYDGKAVVYLVQDGQGVAHGPLTEESVETLNIRLVEFCQFFEERGPSPRFFQVDQGLHGRG